MTSESNLLGHLELFAKIAFFLTFCQISFSLVGSAFAFLFAAVIGLLPGLRGVERC